MQTDFAQRQTSRMAFPFAHLPMQDTEPIIDGTRFPKLIYEDNLRRIAEMEVREDDVWLVSYPKTGTNWIKTILYQIFNKDSLGVQDVKQAPDPNSYIPYIEVCHRDSGKPAIDVFTEMPITQRRIIASHLQPKWMPRQYFEKKPKTIHIMRNPKDTAESYFNFFKKSPATDTREDWSSYLKDFLQGDVPYGAYSDYVTMWCEVNKEANILTLMYEDLKEDLQGGILKTARFLEVEMTEAEAKTIAERCTFDAMKSRSTAESQANSGLFRKGLAGGWKTSFTVAQSEQFDEFFGEKLKHVDFQFRYE
ncbi:sulfotransferase 6B1-like [Ptychodera flava]|uniref:sulfotransferase 6B1-like n=1 Tax=Ptychodera flava TaxID=63121 RepID=UPI00396A8456